MPSSYFTYPTASASAAPSFTSIAGIPGGCNPAHPGSCPSSYFTYPTVTATAAPTAEPTSGSGDNTPTYPNPKPVEGKQWALKDLTRYCGESNEGCDYNFAIEADGKTERCTVIPLHFWLRIQGLLGYVSNPAPAFAVVTVVKGTELAWFGVSDINGKPVTTAPSSPFGSGQFGNLGPEQVYTY
ncbi:surface protein SP1 [Colletotrichum tofieldiae]|nr:surface protein SP1 [Colletotrichum tofieldiae]